MVFSNDGKNRIRDLLNTDINHGELGTDGTAEAASQTDVLAGVAATSIAVATQTADKQITIDYSLPSTTGNGTTFKEFGIFNSSDTLFSRHVFSSLAKTSTEQWQLSITYKVN